jgi:hypothetical protein
MGGLPHLSCAGGNSMALRPCLPLVRIRRDCVVVLVELDDRVGARRTNCRAEAAMKKIRCSEFAGRCAGGCSAAGGLLRRRLAVGS